MKNIRIIIIIIGFAFFGFQNLNAQSTTEGGDSKIYKIETEKVPVEVKEILKNYSTYKISKNASYQFKKGQKVYAFKIERKNFPYELLIDEKGKVKGIKSEEGK